MLHTAGAHRGGEAGAAAREAALWRQGQPRPCSLDAYGFKHDKRDYNVYWDVRKGLIPIVGGARETGARPVPPGPVET